jgi:hypothetical protein
MNPSRANSKARRQDGPSWLLLSLLEGAKVYRQNKRNGEGH